MSSTGSESQSSRSSFSEGGSVVSDNSDAGALANLSGDRDRDTSVQDLLDQNKGLWDAAFSCMLLLTENRSITSYRMLAFRIVFEFLQIFRLVFNTRFLWVIHKDLWVWKTFYWVLFRFLIWDKGYSKYLQGLFVICSVVLVLAVATIAIVMILRKDSTQGLLLRRAIWLVQNLVLLVFSICWVPCLDYMVFMFTCSWGKGNAHLHWTDQICTAMPHLGAMIFAGFSAVLFVIGVMALAMAECSGDHLTRNLTASPVAETAFKVTALKIIMIVVSTCLDDFPKPQAVLMFICPVLSTYYQISSSPYLVPWVNHIWSGLWSGLVYTTALLLALNYHGNLPTNGSTSAAAAEYKLRESMTWAVLYGIFPAVMLGMGISYMVHKWRCRPLEVYEQSRLMALRGTLQIESAAVMRRIHRLRSPEQVEFLARCVRRFDPVTETPLPEAVALSGFIIQAGVAKFPADPAIFVLYANHIIHVKKDPRAARTQLQVATKNNPGIIERYGIFCAMDVVKKSRSDTEGGLDLMAYVECQRNFRACVKAHKLALLAQRAFWRSLMRDDLQLSDMLATMKALQQTEQTALHVYRRVLERYPTNGKILKAWGKFQEWVLHNPGRAGKTYAEAVKHGLGDSLLNLSGDNEEMTSSESGAAVSGSTKVDEKVDGVIIIDATGSMLLTNKVAYKMFGYVRGELEGKNVSLLMPQPFSARHNSYLSNYLTSGVPKILNTVRNVVALRKDTTMFPITLYVKRLSGTGQESVFMGVIRPVVETDPTIVRVWCTPAGTILCSDDRFGDWFGVSAEDLVGRSFSSLSKEPEQLERFIHQSASASQAEADAGALRKVSPMLHRYLPAINVDITVFFGGSDTEVILMLHIQCLTDAQKMMVLDSHGKVVYATSTLASMLGTKVGQLTRMHLQQLIPAPTAQLHRVWMKDAATSRPWAGSCRAGSVVQMQSITGVKIPVKLDIKTIDDSTGDKADTRHVVKIVKVSSEEQLDDQRVGLIVDQNGTVVSVTGAPPTTLFGFDAQRDLVGRPLASFINMFEEFRLMLEKSNSRNMSAGRAFNSQNSSSTVRDDSALLTLLAQAAQAGTGANYRVGVRNVPLQDEQIGKSVTNGISEDGSNMGSLTGGAFSLTGGTNLAELLATFGGKTSKKLRPAVMTVDVLEQDLTDDATVDASGIRAAVQFSIQLWRAELLTGVLEVDQSLKVIKADAAVGQMLGMSPQQLHRKFLTGVMKLPDNIQAGPDLLASVQVSKKASALKSSKRKQEAKVGAVVQAEAKHADGLNAKLELQAVVKEGQANRLILRVKLAAAASTGSLQALLQQAGASSTSKALLGDSAAAAGGKSLRAPAGAGSKSTRSLPTAGSKSTRAAVEQGPRDDADLQRGGSGDSMQGAGGWRNQQQTLNAYPEQEEPRPAGKSRPGSEFGTEYPESNVDDGEESAYGGRSNRFGKGGQQAPAAQGRWPRMGSFNDRTEGYQGTRRSQEGYGSKWATEQDEQQGQDGWRLKAGAAQDYDEYQQYADGYQQQPRQFGHRGSGDGFDPGINPGGSRGPSFELQQPGFGADNDEDAGSDEDADRVDTSSVSERGEDGEEITCDWRRAKRLRRIIRQLDSSVARSALWRFWKGSWYAVALLLAVHIICFGVLDHAVSARQRDVFGVQQTTYAVDKSQMILLRSNYLSKCGFTEFQSYAVCSEKQRQVYIKKHFSNIDSLNYYHQGLFLGFDTNKVAPLGDYDLLSWWLLPFHQELDFADFTLGQPPQTYPKNSSLWELGNKYLYAAREVGYAWLNSNETGPELETNRNWQFIYYNGRYPLFTGYAVSLDMYVRYCWSLLGQLGNIITGLLIAELVVVALAIMVWQMNLIRRVARQRMACYSVFLALPSATLRTMATAPCLVDEEDVEEEADEDDLDVPQEISHGSTSQEQQDSGVGGEGKKEKTVRTVRMSVVGDDPGDGEGGFREGRRGSATGAKRAGNRLRDELKHGWLYKKYKAAQHALRGVMNRTLKINGKKLRPARGPFARFMVPLLLWWILALAMYGASFTNLGNLQAPLTSLQAAAHVQYSIARARVIANIIAFLPFEDSPERITLKAQMREELTSLEKQYFTMLYGGDVPTMVKGDPPIRASAAVFSDAAVSDIFFKTTQCLRADKSTCYDPTSQWYQITHSGLDAMLQRFISDMEEFLTLPPHLQNINATSYEFTWRVAANDMYDGLQAAGDLFVTTTLTALGQLQQLHAILLVCTLGILFVLVIVLLIPFKRQLVSESIRIAGLLSQLPQEADIEGQVKLLVLDVAAHKKPSSEQASKAWSMARGITAAAAAARSAASRAGAAVGNMRNKAAVADDPAAGYWQQQQRQQQDDMASESSAPDWE